MNIHYQIVQAMTPRFDRWRKHINRILDTFDNYMTTDDVYKECIECKKLLFENGKAFAIVSVTEHSRDTHLFIQFAGGSIEGIDELDPIIYKFGQTIGATKAIFIGRKGFAKIMGKRGWKQRFIYLEKEIQ